MDTNIVAKLNDGTMRGVDFINTPYFAELVNKLRQKTNRWKRTMGYGDEREHPSEKMKALKKILITRRVSRDLATTLIDILELFVDGEDFDSVRETGLQLTYTAGVVVVPITLVPNRHDYPLDQPAICIRGYRFLNSNGFTGNEMTDDGEFIRPATDDEIVRICTNIARDNAQALALIINLLF